VTGAPILARTSSAEETRRLAASLAGELAPGDVILLVGDLGTGKTTFTQGLARGLGVTDQVTSPTFTLLRAYPCPAGAVRTLLHADLYRLDRLQDVIDLGIPEMVDDGSVAVVEWGDMAGAVLGPEALTVRLAPSGPHPPPVDGARSGHPLAEGSDEERTVTLLPHGSWTARRPALAARLDPWTGA